MHTVGSALAACLLAFLLLPGQARSSTAPVSEASQACIECHRLIHPGIVADWQRSRHAAISPKEALSVQGLGRKVTGTAVPEALQGTAVGCAECHTQRPGAHADTFEHNGHDIHIVVSPGDCRTCHAEEADQFGQNLMSHAYKNLAANKVYNDLEHSILGSVQRQGGRTIIQPATAATRAEACYSCHGTRLALAGTVTRTTDLAGELTFPTIEGWPNQGVGRVNLDGTAGSCAACHTRHVFSIETARKPYTCKQCHLGPDVPAFKVYEASKHGNLLSTHAKDWNWTAVPWTVGRDFTAPSCAACHVSLVVTSEGEVVAGRSHRMNERLPWRLFGLPYAHPHPISPDTTIIRNRNGQPLPTDLEGGTAAKFLIGREEMDRRRDVLQAVCRSCHGTSWVEGQWARLEATIRETNAKTLAATRLLSGAWRSGLAVGPAAGGSMFDDAIERRWADTWLIHANTIRFASAMGFGGDYGVFADGRYELNKAIVGMQDWIDLRQATAPPKTP
jgi:hypothetical protein